MRLNLYSSLLILFSIIFSSVKAEDRIDTTYFDKDWKVINNKQFADYYRYSLIPENSNSKKIFRSYYFTGELESIGGFISLSDTNDSLSVFEGEVIGYFRNGKMSYKRIYSDGKANGVFIDYSEDELIKCQGTLLDGELNGLYTEFYKDGGFMQIEYLNGRPKYDYYLMSNVEGYMLRYSVFDDSPIWEQPIIDERKTDYRDGKQWQFYNKNGLMVAISNTPIKDYGSWHKVDILITNNSKEILEFDSDSLSSYSINKYGSPTLLPVWSSDMYLAKVRRVQNVNTAIGIISDGLAASFAGQSTSISYTNSPGKTGTAITRTYSYNSAVAYQTQVLSRSWLSSVENQQMNIRDIKEQGYLKRNTIYPGETISGYIHIERISWDRLYVNLKMNDITYMFDWNNKR
ncbi:MAG: toxin-antitoxin system YwqK family antitoxin [Bacteroidales bacterium]